MDAINHSRQVWIFLDDAVMGMELFDAVVLNDEICDGVIVDYFNDDCFHVHGDERLFVQSSF